MAKQSGLGDNLYVAGFDVSGDIGSLDSISMPLGVLDVTAINKSAYERIGGERDGSIEFTSFFNPATSQEHAALSTLPTADVHVMYARGAVLGNPGACLVSKQINYDGSRATSGAFTFKVSAQANAFGLEWGKQATAGLRTDASAVASPPSVDLVAGSSFGLQAYLQVISLGSGTPTVKLQGSSDDGVGDPYADITGGSFGVVTAPSTQRIATASNQAIERYARAVTTGSFTNLVFAVVVIRNEIAVTF